jgi:hypothetical protein
MSYDAWRTRTPEDDAMHGVGLRSGYPKTVYRDCPGHGWTAHIDDGPRFGAPICELCRAGIEPPNKRRK